MEHEAHEGREGHEAGASAPVQLRLGETRDADAVRALTLAAYRPWVALIGREPLPMTVDYQAALREHRFDLAIEAGELIGLIETHAATDHLLVVNVAVAPAHQSAGVGRQLLAHAETLARRDGLAALRLYTNAKFARNIALYERLGYVVDREEASERGVTTHMVKILDPDTARRI